MSMELRDVLQQMIQENTRAGQPTDLRIGTVTKADPLEITINTQMAPLRAGVLLLTECVVEKKIPIFQHTHEIHDTATGGGSCDPALLESQIICQEFGQALPVENGYIILNRALAVGDEVILLRVQNGQRFIVLSRVFKG
mgnify:FL=1